MSFATARAEAQPTHKQSETPARLRGRLSGRRSPPLATVAYRGRDEELQFSNAATRRLLAGNLNLGGCVEGHSRGESVCVRGAQVVERLLLGWLVRELLLPRP